MTCLPSEQLSTIVRCFESTRCSFGLLQELDFAGYSSLALALTEYNPILVHEKPWYTLLNTLLFSDSLLTSPLSRMRFSLALRALQFKTAAEILRNKFLALGSPQLYFPVALRFPPFSLLSPQSPAKL